MSTTKQNNSSSDVDKDDGSSSSSDLNRNLIQASKCGDLATVKYLVEEQHIDPQLCCDEIEDTPLHSASGHGCLDIVRYLVEEKGCMAECQTKVGITPLHRAASGGVLHVMKYLITERKCDPMCRGCYGKTPLHYACEFGYLHIVEYLAADQKVDTSCREDENGNTPLHVAAWSGHLDIVKYLVEEQKCDVMCGNVKYGSTSLHRAASGGKLDVVQYLIECQKVDPSCLDKYGSTPLHNASYFGNLSVVRSLIEDYLCDPGIRNIYEKTAFDDANGQGKTHITDYLKTVEEVASSDLRRDLVRHLKPYQKKAKPTGTVLGTGSYGTVMELTLASGEIGKVVAGKVFKISSCKHQDALANKLCAELILMTQLHHPNIVECKGVCLLVEQTMPVLLMERLKCSLHAYLLDRNNTNLELETKVSILCDVANGLVYLHSQNPAIIHRDLTGKNVLLDLELKAKIADFGNARIMDLDPEASPDTLTALPGTLEYMPPEALGSSAKYKYGPRLDVFSFGHLSLFTILQSPIHPILPATYIESNQVRGYSELERRKQYLDKAKQLLGEKHSLVVLIKQCLHNIPEQRPPTEVLVTRLQNCLSQDTTLESHKRRAPKRDNEEDILLEPKRIKVDGHTVEKSDTHEYAGLNCEPRDVDFLNEVAAEIPTLWREMGMELGLKPNQLDCIETEQNRNQVRCFVAVFSRWREQQTTPCTWATIIQALQTKAVSQHKLAQELKNKFAPP